jgi:5-methylcytosine-specific restriction endonuclease McrA
LSWEVASKETADKIMNADDSAFWLAYEEYLAGPVWRKKREKILGRSGGICEGCREKTATQVHHLSYEHVGDEFLFELVAVCDDCHNKLHNQK